MHELNRRPGSGSGYHGTGRRRAPAPGALSSASCPDAQRRLVQVMPGAVARGRLLPVATCLIGLLAGCERKAPETQPGTPTTSAAFVLPEVDPARLPPGLQERHRQLRQNVQRAPNNSDLIGGLGCLYYVYDYVEPAVACFRRASELAPQVLRWHYYLALASLRTAQRDQAIAEFERVLELDSSYAPAYSRCAALFVDSDRQRAERLFRRALELDPQDPTATLGLGLCQAAAGNMEQAQPHIEQALRLQPDYREAHAAMARVLLAQGKQEEAQRHQAAAAAGRTPIYKDPYFEDLLRNGFHLDTLLHDASVLAERGLSEPADRALALAREADRTGFRTQLALAGVRLRQNRPQEAADACRAALQLQPEAPEPHAMLGDALARLENYEEAEAAFQRALELSPDMAYALERFSQMLLRRQRGAEALALWQGFLERHADSPWGQLQLGLTLLALDRDAEARPQLEACLANAPDPSLPRFYLGRIAARAGDTAGARELWNELLKDNPAFVDAYIALAELALTERDFAAAAQHMRAGLERAPDSAGLANGLAWVLATAPDDSLRNGTEAVRLAEQARDATQGLQHEFLDTLAAAYAEVGRFDDAIATAEQAVKLAAEAAAPAKAEEYRTRLELYRQHMPYRDIGQ